MKFFAFLLPLTLCAAVPTPPSLRLDDNVQPKHYLIDLTLAPEKDAFTGTAAIDIHIAHPTQTIWIHASSLTFKQAEIEAGGKRTALTVTPGNANFTALTFSEPLSGPATLHFDYAGKVSRTSSAGLFAMKDANTWYLYSQFEPTDARRAFPCFDEPRFKTPWQLRLHVPKTSLAFSNTPALSESDDPSGYKNIVFKETPPLPSYLVALAVGPFDVVNAGRVGNVPLRIMTPRGKASQARFAATAIAPLLKTLESYFGMPFPYEKLDSVVMPISTFAMENAGLITYPASDLLAKPTEDTEERQRDCAYVAAHEMAHQWFGDLVTTSWWNDTWLNEAFASWMERKAVERWKPDWPTNIAVQEARARAMRLDSLATARQIRQPIENESDIANAFDDITYEKGAAVIHMFERYLGEENFRKGVQLYLKQHAWGATTAADFTAALSQAAGRDIAPAFNSFLEQPGVPEISVSLDCAARKPAIQVSQKRLLPIGSKDDAPHTWDVPLCVAYAAGDSSQHECALVTSASQTIELKHTSSCPAWLLANDGEAGYYDVNYSQPLLTQLLSDGMLHLSVPEQVGILGDLNQLVATGDVSPEVILAQVPRFSHSQERALVSSAIGLAELVEGRDVPPGLRPNAERFIRATFGAEARRLGWIAQPGESADRVRLRSDLVPFVALDGEDSTLQQQARALAQKWIETRTGLPSALRGSILQAAAERGDAAFFDALLAVARREQDPRIREAVLRALGGFRDPALAERAMNLLLTNDFDPRESLHALLFGPLAFPETEMLPFQFLRAHIDQLVAKLPREVGEDFAATLPGVGAPFCDASSRSQLQAFFADRIRQYAGGQRNLAQRLETIDHCIAQRAALAPGFTNFLGAFSATE